MHCCGDSDGEAHVNPAAGELPPGGPPLRIVSLGALRERGAQPDFAGLSQIEAIFFSSSRTQSFPSAAARNSFRERWLGRYINSFPDDFLLAVVDGDEGPVIGYLAGCLADPARHPLFADIGYFAQIQDLTPRYPAHLHVNVDAAWRNHGIGALLVEAFCARAGQRGSSGVHVVTGAQSRNVGFYKRCGFRRLCSLSWSGSELVVLGRTLAHPA